MISCPWCGTHQNVQPNCRNCGGPLPPASVREIDVRPGEFPAPPPAPRAISDRYVWRLLSTDAWGIVGGIFTFIGTIFTFLGTILAFALTPLGLIFACLGLLFLTVGGLGLTQRYRAAQTIVNVLREGQATRGEIVSVEENLSVRVNQRHPWVITYRFSLNGQAYQGQVSTLTTPGEALQPGQPACVLYQPNAPEHNALYPHP